MNRVLGAFGVGDHNPDYPAIHEEYLVGYLAGPAQYGLAPEGCGVTSGQEVGQLCLRNVNHLSDCLIWSICPWCCFYPTTR